MICNKCGAKIEKPVCEYCGKYHDIFFVSSDEFYEMRKSDLVDYVVVQGSLRPKEFFCGHKVIVDREMETRTKSVDELINILFKQQEDFQKNNLTNRY